MQMDESAERVWFLFGVSLHYADGRLVNLQVHPAPCGYISSWRSCRGPLIAIRETCPCPLGRSWIPRELQQRTRVPSIRHLLILVPQRTEGPGESIRPGLLLCFS